MDLSFLFGFLNQRKPLFLQLVNSNMVSIALGDTFDKLLSFHPEYAPPVCNDFIYLSVVVKTDIVAQAQGDADFNRRLLPAKARNVKLTLLNPVSEV